MHYYEEQKQLHTAGLDELNTEKQSKLEILFKNRKDVQAQAERIKQTIVKVLDKYAFLEERISTLFRQ